MSAKLSSQSRAASGERVQEGVDRGFGGAQERGFVAELGGDQVDRGVGQRGAVVVDRGPDLGVGVPQNVREQAAEDDPLRVEQGQQGGDSGGERGDQGGERGQGGGIASIGSGE